ncbi:MAG: stage II sporulation protein R [Oscillospiraceae bacterium]|jgi:hypothetical protein|nr:stage II sporulation protein R [Oscillospiraceae bacterium]
MRFFHLQNNTKDHLRLRVVAHSDSEADQRRKLCVRDAVLPLFAQYPPNLSAVLATARAIDPTARLRAGRLCFGGYRSPAVQLTLGQGAGHNWWGIVFESACLPEEEWHFESWFVNLFRKWGWI